MCVMFFAQYWPFVLFHACVRIYIVLRYAIVHLRVYFEMFSELAKVALGYTNIYKIIVTLCDNILLTTT